MEQVQQQQEGNTASVSNTLRQSTRQLGGYKQIMNMEQWCCRQRGLIENQQGHVLFMP